VTFRTDQERAAENYARTPRPFSFIRPKFHRDTAEWLRDTLRDIKDEEFDLLTKYRTEGRDEEDQDVQETRSNIHYCITIIKDLERGLIDMVGPVRPEDNR
jgi:hypothetical protein